MPVTVKGKLRGRAVKATRSDAGEVVGDPQLLQAAVAQVKDGDVVGVGHPYPSVEPSLASPLAFAITVGSVLDVGTFREEGTPLPPDDAPKGAIY